MQYFNPPYDYATLEGVIKKMSPEGKAVDRGAVVQAWMKVGASSKDNRADALKAYFAEAKLLPMDADGKTVALPGGEADKSAAPKIAGPIAVARRLANAEEAGELWHQLKSGSIFRYVTHGDGAKSPTPNSQCDVSYVGTLVNGKQFDKGEHVKFAPTGVIKAWCQILQLLREGDAIEMMAPPAEAYGERGVPGPDGIPGHSTLCFTLTLHKVDTDGKPAADADQLLEVMFGAKGADL